MKKATTILVGLIIVISSAVFASGKETIAEAKSSARIVPINAESVYKLVYDSQEAGIVKVNFYDQKGFKFFTDVVKNEKGFIRPYSFKNLPQGDYVIEIVDKFGSVQREIAFEVVKEKADFQVALNAETDKRFKLTVLGETLAPVFVKIYDANQRLVTEDYVDNSKSFSKVYNLSQVPASDFTFEVISKNKIVTKKTL
ncbi:MAG: hypothetical protein ACNS62_06035 [Candidatus Cyclobacteriaceae bacterium M3_2C_046]